MQTFDDLWPGAPFDFEPQGDFCIFKCVNVAPCWNCGRLTHWVEVNFEAHLCSPACEREKYREYFEACREAAKRDDADGDLPF